MADLGDLSEFLKDGSISNLDWLDVTEEDYRKQEALPKQNLDVVPDLEAAWMHKDEKPGIYAVPNVQPVPSFAGAGEIHTMGDMSAAHGRLRARPEEIRKTARLALMQSTDMARFKQALTSRYDKGSLQAARDVIAEVLNERGLLGKLYIQADDFPACDRGSPNASKFAARYAKEAKFVIAKPQCGECAHAMKGPTGSDLCSVFHKEIQVEVPYSDALAVQVEQMQKAKGKAVEGAHGLGPRVDLKEMVGGEWAVTVDGIQWGPPGAKRDRDGSAETTFPTKADAIREYKKHNKTAKERIRLAMLADNFHAPGPSPMPKPTENVMRLMKPVQAVDALTSKKSQQVVAMLRREMLKGRGITEIAENLKVAFTPEVLTETRAAWEPIFREGGLYGAVYSTQESFDDCHEGADFLAKHNPTVRAMVTGPKCGSCIYNKISRCLIYGKPLVKDASAIYTPEVVDAVLWEGQTSGRLPPEIKAASQYGNEPREQLKQMHRVASHRHLPVLNQTTRLDVVKAYHGMSQETPRAPGHPVVAAVRRMLNEGLYGQDLLRAMKLRFQPQVLMAAKDELRKAISEQGLQGVFYIDPAAYDDYGRGCKEAERLHRTRLVEYAKVGSACGNCVHQTQPGFCSVLSKKLVNEPPYYDKAAQQQEILSSGASTEIRFDQLINNGLSMMAEYDLQNRLPVELNPEKMAASPLDIELGKVAKRQP